MVKLQLRRLRIQAIQLQVVYDDRFVSQLLDQRWLSHRGITNSERWLDCDVKARGELFGGDDMMKLDQQCIYVDAAYLLVLGEEKLPFTLFTV